MYRSELREYAFLVIFGMDASKDNSDDAIENFLHDREITDDHDEFFIRLVKGVEENIKEIDSIIEKYLKDYTLGRLSKVGLNVLRLMIYEIKYCDDIPDKVSINEGLELVKKYDVDKTKKFVNGIVASYLKDVESKAT